MADQSFAKTLRLSKLEDDRDQKRKQLEDLNNQRLAIEAQYRELDAELENLDQEIDTLELEIAEDQTDDHNNNENNNNNAGIEPFQQTDRQGARLPCEIFDQPRAADDAVHHQPVSWTPTNDDTAATLRMRNTASSVVTQQQHKENKRPSSTLDSFLGVSKPVDTPRIAEVNSPPHNNNSSTTAVTATSVIPQFPTGQYNPTNPGTALRDDYSQQRFAGHHPTDPNAMFANDSFPWSNQLKQELAQTFRIQGFRANQREIINATLSGVDVFCVMRTYVPRVTTTTRDP
jgi:hypothetical protein